MKLLSFEHQGKPSWGMALKSGIVDLGLPAGGRYATLRAALDAGAVARTAQDAAARPADFGMDSVRLLPVIPNPQKIFCIGLNYEEHRIEANRPKTGEPTVFLRTPTSQVGHRQPLLLPPESAALDYEGEIAIVIGKAGRRIAEANAWDHIAGYSAYNDGSLRDWQMHTSQWTGGKNFDATGAFGPWLVTRDEIADGAELSLVTRLNGVEMQRATTAMMIFSIPRQIAYISAFATLLPGDVIVTGTPGGVGFKRTPPVYMKHGDTVEIEVSQVGTLVNQVVREAS